MSGRWVILLAGGEGSRVRGLTRDVHGSPAPKQFCRLDGDRTLFRHALDRARTLTGDAYVVPVVQMAHRRWWADEVRGLPPGNVLGEPGNRGTAVAILRALRHIVSLDPAAIVVVLPSDHGAEDEVALCESLGRAAHEASRWPSHAILVGMEPVEVEADYGWILPAMRGRTETAAVQGFYEKPDADAARRLAGGGALINTFILAATGAALSRMFSATLPELASVTESMTGPGELPCRDFSRDVLERSARSLRVLLGRACGWSDLGTPARLHAWLARGNPPASRGERHDLAHA